MPNHIAAHHVIPSQPIVINGPTGEIATLSLSKLEDLMFQRLVNCSAYTSHIAMCAGVLFVLLITMPRDRLKTAVHMLNILSLISSIVFSAAQYINMTGPAFQIGVQLFNDATSLSKGDISFSHIVPLFGSIVVGFIEFSLVLQCRSVYASNRKIKVWVTFVTTLVATAVTSWCIAADIRRSLSFSTKHVSLTWIDKSKNVVFAFSICFFSSIFVSRLWRTIHMQRNLGFRESGPLQVIFIMACQTMILPLVFCFIGILCPDKFAVSHTARVLVAISLPLSSVWATAQAEMRSDDNVSSLMQSFIGTVDFDAQPGLALSPEINTTTPQAPERPNFDRNKNMDITIGAYLKNKGYEDDIHRESGQYF